MADGDVTSEGMRFIKSWLNAHEALAAAERAVRRAQCDLANAESHLAKWMLPPDAKPGEKIAVWFGDSLIQVEAGTPPPPIPEGSDVGIGGTDPKVTVRSRGKHFSELR